MKPAAFVLPADASPELLRLMKWRCLAILASDGQMGTGRLAIELALDLQPPSRDAVLELIAKAASVLRKVTV